MVQISGTYKERKNVVADALSRLEKTENNPAKLLNQMEIVQSPEFPNKTRQELFYQYQIANTLAEEEEHKENPVELSYIKEKQDQSPTLKELVKDSEDYHTKIFHGAGNDYEMIYHKEKIMIPQSIKQKIMEWYHTTLLHPGRDRYRGKSSIF